MTPGRRARDRGRDKVLLRDQVESKTDPETQILLGADTQYQDPKFVVALHDRGVAPHVSEYMKDGANLGKNALSEAERLDPRRAVSQPKRKLIERVFGWAKHDRPLRQTKLRGLRQVDRFYRLVVTAYNRLRLGKLIPMAVEG